MKCTRIKLPGTPLHGAIVCHSGRREAARYCACGAPAPLLCDWRTGSRGRGVWEPWTCDKPVCRACAISPAPEKDLCREHGQAYLAWLAGRTNSTDGMGP